MARQNPSLRKLSEFLRHQPRTACNSLVSYGEIEATGDMSLPKEINTSELVARVTSGLKKKTIAVIESVHHDDIDSLGSCLDIDPFFFCGHIASSYGDIEKDEPPPLMALPPSRLVSGAFVNIHHQKVLDLGDEVALRNVPYDLALMANVTRSVRPLPALSGRPVALLRSCTSVIKKDLPGDFWICLILVDPDSDIVVHPKYGIPHRFVRAGLSRSPRRIATEAFYRLPTYTEHQAPDRASRNFEPLNPREKFLSLFHASAPGWRARNPSILSLAYYPIKAVIQEWILYSLLMGRYVKYYEYSTKTVQSRIESFEKNDMLELHRWRRRSLQSIHKLDMLRRFVEHWVCKEESPSRNVKATTDATTREDSMSWNLLIGDIKYLEGQIMQHARSLEALNPIITALVQLVDSKRAISQAEDTRRLTYIAIVFLPMSFMTGIFSMSESYGPGSDRFWIYWVVALPLTVFLIGSLALDLRFDSLSSFWARIQTRMGGS